MDDVSRYVPRDEGQRYEELRELYRPSIASRMEEILEELWEDPQFFAEVKERFEKGRRRGIYPALERDLGQLPMKREISSWSWAGTAPYDLSFLVRSNRGIRVPLTGA
jgi:hypothetical protein